MLKIITKQLCLDHVPTPSMLHLWMIANMRIAPGIPKG